VKICYLWNEYLLIKGAEKWQKRKRRNHPGAFKAKRALTALSGEKTLEA
jgi:hypothetical protein